MCGMCASMRRGMPFRIFCWGFFHQQGLFLIRSLTSVYSLACIACEIWERRVLTIVVLAN